MLKKTITYTNFLDEEVTSDFYFNVSKAELVDIQIGTAGTYSERLKLLINEKDMRKLLDVLKTFVKDSYGVRTPDGRGFIKSEEAWNNFQGSGAYDVLFLEFFSDTQNATDFVNGIMPQALVEQARKSATTNGFRPGAETLPKSRRDALNAEHVALTEPVVTDEAKVLDVLTQADREELQMLRNQQNQQGQQ